MTQQPRHASTGPNDDATADADVPVEEKPGPAEVSTATGALRGLLDDVPPEQLPLDPRAIARSSLIAGRNGSLWWICAGLVVVVLLAVLVSARVGATVLAVLLAIGAVVRAMAPAPGPAALSIRSRAFDVATLLVLAIGIGALAQVIPPT